MNIFELRTYTLHVGKLSKAIEVYQDLGWPALQKYKKNIIIDSQNSGTLGRLIMGILIDTPHKIKIIGDKSLSRRDFNRIAEPLKKFGTDIRLTNKGLPLTIKGSENPSPINYLETVSYTHLTLPTILRV